jgi:hypothetical protein
MRHVSQNAQILTVSHHGRCFLFDTAIMDILSLIRNNHFKHSFSFTVLSVLLNETRESILLETW